MNELTENELLGRLANETGLALALVDVDGRQVSERNNNSICRMLNPDETFSPACAAYCGKAYDRAFGTGKGVAYECHAGLQCIAMPLRSIEPPLVAIVGRTFVKSENYRRATQRAISGDWRSHQTARFFENVLISQSRDIVEQTVQKLAAADAKRLKAGKRDAVTAVEEPRPQTQTEPAAGGQTTSIVEKFKRQFGLSAPSEKPAPAPQVDIDPAAPDLPSDAPNTGRLEGSRAWRSFFGSLLKMDYSAAAAAILEFLADQYDLTALLWLERREHRFETTAGYGEMQGRRIRLGIAPDDERLVDALANEMPLELTEKPRGERQSVRSLTLFPLAVDSEITGAVAVLDTVDDAKKDHIARTCISIAAQLEILRLRNEVARREEIGGAVRRIGETVRRIDADDFWVTLTQTAAETLGAERASLMVFDERSDELALKAIVGSPHTSLPLEPTGRRVADHVFKKGEPVIVSDISRTGLPSAPDRHYRTGAFMSCPITLGGRELGVINFTDRIGEPAFDRGSFEVFQAIAPQLAVAIDRASLKEKAGEFEQLSVTDPLTGLLNRRYIEARLAEEIKRSNRHGFPMSFVMLDVDSFKSYNDRFGHPAGDEALKIIGNVIRETLRGADVAARMGGEEFAILLPQTTGEEALTIAERIRYNIERTPFPYRPVTASLGIAHCSAELCISADLISAADQALYEAKRRGRNRVLSFGTFTSEHAK